MAGTIWFWQQGAGGVNANVSLTTVAAIATVHASSVTANADTTPSTIAAQATVSAPTISANADVTATTVASTTTVPASTSVADADSAPSTVSAQVQIDTPSVETPAEGVDADVVFLEAVVNLQATPVDADQIDLSWDAITGASEYLVERNGVVVATNPDTTYSDTGLDPETTYSYRVKAVA